jgi:hypothetical protein
MANKLPIQNPFGVTRERVKIDYRTETEEPTNYEPGCTTNYHGGPPYKLTRKIWRYADCEAGAEIELDLNYVRNLIRKAFHNKQKRSKAGGVTVRLFNWKQLTEPTEEVRR